MRVIGRLVALSAACLLLGTACGDESPQAGRLRGVVVSGPTCPAEPDDGSPSPGCDDRPVQGATIVVRPQDGGEDARVATDGRGVYEIGLAPGGYLVVPQEVQGLLGTPDSIEVTVVAGRTTAVAPLRYDTGIR